MMNLYPHQNKVLFETEDKNRVAYYLDMGLGKTFVGSEKMEQLNAMNNLLICQKSKIKDWFSHYKKYYDYLVLDLTDKVDFTTYLALSKDEDIKIIGIINYELAWRRKDLLKVKNLTLMLDESSLIQNSKAKQSKFILKLNFKNVILLSGTPCSGKYENLWTQAKLLGWEISEKLYKDQFIEYDFLKNHYGKKILNPVTQTPIKVIIGYKNEERLKRKLREHGALFMQTKDVFDLPTQNYTTLGVDTTKYYEKFMKNSVIDVEGVELVGSNILTKMLYAQMLCGQYNHNKLDALDSLIQSTNDRLIIFYNFKEELQRLIEICEFNHRPISQVNGSVKDLTAYECESNSVTLCQYQAASKGLNLQKANKIIYFTPTQSVENFMQSQKRIHRIGQESPCFYYMLVCKGSIEEKIYKALERGVNYTIELFKEDFKE